MAADDRMISLKTEHAALEEKLEQEISSPHPDPAVVAEIKKQKLRIKDEIAGHIPA